MLRKVCIILCFLTVQKCLMAGNLAELIQITLERNLELKISALEIEQSLIDEKTAHNALVPDLYLSGSRTFNSYYDNYQKGLNLTKDTWTFSLRLSQSYPGLGKIPAIAKEIAQMKTDIKKVYNDNKKITLVGKLTKIYFQLLRDQELKKIHEMDLKLIHELLKIAKLNEDVGLVLHNDILRIEVEQHNTNSALTKVKSSFEDLKYDLAAILDVKNPQEIKIQLPQSLKFKTSLYTSEKLLDDLFKNDYSFNLARSDLKILNKIVSSASKATLPTLNINSTYKYGNKYGSDRGGKDNKDLVTTFELVTPVYDGNDIKNMIRKAEKSKEIGELTLKNLSNNKKSELEKATNDYKDATLRIELAEKMVEQSHENMRIVLTRYQAGAASIVELIDAQRLLTDSLQLAVNAYYDERAKLSEIFLLTHMFEELKTMDQNSSYLNIDLLKNTLIIPGDNQ